MSQEKRNALPDGDDGRTIAKMNVDGMPWYTGGFQAPSGEEDNAPAPERRPMSEDEARGYAWAAVKASLLIGAVFAAAYGAFLLFCRFVWFR